ncbi:MAG: Clp protease N-terminal domain-containing protein [Candidatus Limnocylindrales bacterium]
MDTFFTKLTDRARQALTEANAAAGRFHQNYIGPENLLIGLIHNEDEAAARVLVNLGVELSKVRTDVESLIDAGDRPVSGEVGLTRAAKRVIELAIDTARGMEHRYLGTEHLLLGVLRQGDYVAGAVLNSLGVTFPNARDEVLRLAPVGSLPVEELATRGPDLTSLPDALVVHWLPAESTESSSYLVKRPRGGIRHRPGAAGRRSERADA